MAKPILEQVLDFARNIFSPPKPPAEGSAVIAPPAPGGPTGVQKYLAQLESEAGESSKAATGVEKYLATTSAPAAPNAKPAEKPAAAPRPAAGPAKLKVKPELKPAAPAPASSPTPVADSGTPAAAKPATAAKAATPAAAQSAADSSKRCQASTARGGQCKHTQGLVSYQCKIEGKDYTFDVCQQHNNKSFKPHAGFEAAK
jgi:hypothetical protein